MTKKIQIGLIGARGYVGAELLRLIEAYPELELVLAVSREWAGQNVCEVISDTRSTIKFEALDPDVIAKRQCDALFLALPNDKCSDIISAIDRIAPNTHLIDLSADHRFDPSWAYGQPETKRESIAYAKRISNPGCYATAMQLALAPIKYNLQGAPSCFGVSGYSGAGSSPSEKNNPESLHNNLIPYQLTNHLHEREVSRHLGFAVQFMPHVGAHFRGITMTVNAQLNTALTVAEVIKQFEKFYADEPLVNVQESAPWVSAVAGKHVANLGGFSVSDEGKRLVIVCTLDNLLKGAATQAMQNLNLSLGLPEFSGIIHE